LDGIKDFDDIAMIMHNNDNGETCWFQSEDGDVAMDGENVPVPHAEDAPEQTIGGITRGWHKPSDTAGINCIHCHDNGPWMNSRWMFNSGIDLRDGLGPYINDGFAFKDWKKPKFVTVDAFELKSEPGHTFEKKSCTSCHKIHSGESDDVYNPDRFKGAGGKSLQEWINFTVGRKSYITGDFPKNSNATGQGFDIAYWMPPRPSNFHDVYAADAADWGVHYKKHVDKLLDCAKSKGASSGRGDPCKEMKPQPPPASGGAVAAAAPPGVHLEADTNNAGTWAYHSTAVSDGSDCTPLADPTCTYTVSQSTLLKVRWSADADHLNCFIATTFPAGVEVNSELDGSGTWTGTGSNWLLSESPQTIGVLTVPGDYYFHINCNDDDEGAISASLTFRIAGQPPTVLHVKGIVDGVGTMAFDYPSPASPNVGIAVVPTSEVVVAWTASNVVNGTCVLNETFDPPGPTPRTFPDESGFESVTLYSATDQNYTLTCTGDDGQAHSVNLTLQVSARPPTPTTTCTAQGGGDCRTRTLSFTMVPPAPATGDSGTSAIKITMVDLQNPIPPNNNPPGPCCPPGNFIAFDTVMNSICAGGSNQGYRCASGIDCPGSTCPATLGCTEAAGSNAQGSCARWVGPPLGYLESNDNPGIGNYRAARLQCAPYYHDWAAEPILNVVGAEMVPSSAYLVQAYGDSCKGNESSCSNVSAAVAMTTRRAGDIATPFQGGPPLNQPNAVDVANAVNKFRNLAGAPSKVIAQVQPNFPEPNSDFNAIDVVTVVDNVRGFGYTYSGPCTCPSSVPCNTTQCAGASACTGLYGAGATCVKTCTSGPRTGQPCNNNLNCGSCIGGPAMGAGAAGIPCDANSDCASNNCGTGTCPTGATPGFCRDRCGRCTP
jgi:hypothetical protein